MYFIQKAIIATGFVSLPFITFAQDSSALPYNENQIEFDQEMSPSGTATDKYKAIHDISDSVRGIRGVNGIVYWVSEDKGTLSAYEGARLLWRTDVAEAFESDFQQPQIEKLVFASNVIFVLVSKKGFAEINRETGQLGSKQVD
ncbi:hypothetical protein ACMA1I_05870 [Pontibacter sp. 13R65]|uniref:hypothetical protein n=1 Tax=Pontibacter sp. 13R65 TaxID=3127458 RepID=UPI00301BA511